MDILPQQEALTTVWIGSERANQNSVLHSISIQALRCSIEENAARQRSLRLKWKLLQCKASQQRC